MKTVIDIIKEKESGMITVDSNVTLREAMEIMIERGIASILVEENGKISGIWTEHDLLTNAVRKGFDPEKDIIKDFMNTSFQVAPHDISIYKLMDIFLGKRIRHSLIEKDGTYIGILSIGDVMRASLMEKTRELDELNSLVKWDYYENWKFKKKS